MFTYHQYVTSNSLNGIIWKETHSITFKTHFDVCSICKQFFLSGTCPISVCANFSWSFVWFFWLLKAQYSTKHK